MSDDLKDLMRSACKAYEAAGVQGENGARAMREGLDRIEELEAKLAKAVEALNRIQDGSYGKNAAIARANLEELKGQDDDTN